MPPLKVIDLRRQPINRIIPNFRACPTGIEPVTPGLEGRCSIRLSYGRIIANDNARGRWIEPELDQSDKQDRGRGRGIRTLDIQLPKLALYQAELYPGIAALKRPRAPATG